jgi:hypothetical protein
MGRIIDENNPDWIDLSASKKDKKIIYSKFNI